MNTKFIIKQFFKALLIIAAGAGIGYLYYHFFGCTNGCAITSNPTKSILFGALMGLIIAFGFVDFKPKEKTDGNEEPTAK